LKGTIKHGIQYTKGIKQKYLTIITNYNDVDWVGQLDEKMSINHYAFIVVRGAIS
jgi:uncharacterized protein YkvS